MPKKYEISNRIKVIADNEEIIKKNKGLSLFAERLDEVIDDKTENIFIILAGHGTVNSSIINKCLENCMLDEACVVVIDGCPKSIRSCFESRELKKIYFYENNEKLTKFQSSYWGIRSEKGIEKLHYDIIRDAGNIIPVALIDSVEDTMWILFNATGSEKNIENIISYIIIDNWFTKVKSKYTSLI